MTGKSGESKVSDGQAESWALSDSIPPLWVWCLIQCQGKRRAPELQRLLEKHCRAHEQTLNVTLRRMVAAGLLQRVDGSGRAVWWRTTPHGVEVKKRNLRFLRWSMRRVEPPPCTEDLLA